MLALLNLTDWRIIFMATKQLNYFNLNSRFRILQDGASYFQLPTSALIVDRTTRIPIFLQSLHAIFYIYIVDNWWQKLHW